MDYRRCRRRAKRLGAGTARRDEDARPILYGAGGWIESAAAAGTRHRRGGSSWLPALPG
jgi:hypothetical protein